MNKQLTVDIAIVGGGITGLWLLSRLRAKGYGALLIEANRLGAGQTITAQGIIRSSIQYELQDENDEAARAISDIPEIWQSCLAGTGEVNLSAVQMLTEQQYLWVANPPPRFKFLSFFSGRSRRSRMEDDSEQDDRPDILRPIPGTVYRLDEPVLNTGSLLQTLAEPHREALVLNQSPAVLSSDGAITLRAPGHELIELRPRYTVFTAGADSIVLGWVPVRVRHMHMVMVRGEELPDDIYAHCLGTEAISRLSITSHRDLQGQTVWYLGGELAVAGRRLRGAQQLQIARRELATLLPWVDLSEAEFASVRIRRAEVRLQQRDDPPPVFGIVRTGSTIAVWTSRLTAVPLLVDEILKRLDRDNFQPEGADLSLLADWPRPEVALYPWDSKHLSWS